MSAAASPDALIRYCPECGHIGPVPATAESCCSTSCGMSMPRWQAEKVQAMLGPLRAALSAAKAVAYSNGFDAALPDKMQALRAAVDSASGQPRTFEQDAQTYGEG